MVLVCFEAHHLKSETETYEEKEQQLVNDCVKELSESLSLVFSSYFFPAGLRDCSDSILRPPWFSLLTCRKDQPFVMSQKDMHLSQLSSTLSQASI